MVQSDFIPKPVAGSATLTSDLDTYSSSSKQRPSDGTTSSSGGQGLQSDVLWLQRTSTDDVDGGNSCLDKNGFSSDAAAAYDELVGSKRRSSESSGDHSTGQASLTWRASSELSTGSSNEAKGGGSSLLRTQRSTNQNIRVPQGIPGREAVPRKPFVNPQSSSSTTGAAGEELDFDTNPLRRLRDSQSGFGKPVFRPTGASAALPRSAASQPPPLSNNLNANLSFFDKLKEQEQLRKM